MASIESVIVPTQVDPVRVELAYYQLISWLEEEGYNRAELMTALIVCLGTQYNGKPIPPDETGAFVKSMTEYLAAYFAREVAS